MPINITMPALSPTMEKGNLAKWLKKEGDAIKSGDVIAEIETDKATMEVEAVDEGTVGKIVVAEGTADVRRTGVARADLSEVDATASRDDHAEGDAAREKRGHRRDSPEPAEMVGGVVHGVDDTARGSSAASSTACTA